MATAFVSPILRSPISLAPHVELSESAAQWDTYVTRHPDATLYHLHAWKIVAEKAYGMQAPFLVARDGANGSVRGVLPLVRVPRPFSPYLTTGIFGAYGSLLADDDRYARALVSAAMRRIDAGEGRFLHMKLLGAAPDEEGLERREVWVTAKRDLGESAEALWRLLPSKMRWAVRHAERAGLTAMRWRHQMDDFYDVLSENMLRKGAPIYGRPFFEELLRAIGPNADLVTLRHQGRAVSAALVAWFNGTMYVPFASSRPAFFKLRANNLLFWEIMRIARQLGMHTLDFGSSLRDSTVLDFKLGWEPRVETIASYVYAGPNAAPALAPADSAIARNAVKIWSRLPPRVAQALGPRVSRWIA